MKAFPILFFTLMQWALNAAEVPKFKRIQLTDKFYAEGASAGNFNNDKHSDVVSGPYWYAGPDFKKGMRFMIRRTSNRKLFPILIPRYDVNGDGMML